MKKDEGVKVLNEDPYCQVMTHFLSSTSSPPGVLSFCATAPCFRGHYYLRKTRNESFPSACFCAKKKSCGWIFMSWFCTITKSSFSASLCVSCTLPEISRLPPLLLLLLRWFVRNKLWALKGGVWGWTEKTNLQCHVINGKIVRTISKLGSNHNSLAFFSRGVLCGFP